MFSDRKREIRTKSEAFILLLETLETVPLLLLLLTIIYEVVTFRFFKAPFAK